MGKAKLTKKEKTWLDELQGVLNRCPSPNRIGFYTIGDPTICLYDLSRYDEVTKRLDTRQSSEWCTAVADSGAGFDEVITFPAAVESTAG